MVPTSSVSANLSRERGRGSTYSIPVPCSPVDLWRGVRFPGFTDLLPVRSVVYYLPTRIPRAQAISGAGSGSQDTGSGPWISDLRNHVICVPMYTISVHLPVYPKVCCSAARRLVGLTPPRSAAHPVAFPRSLTLVAPCDLHKWICTHTDTQTNN